jgi:hypothetical protein
VKVERSYDESFGWLADEKVQWSFHNMTFSQFLKVYLTPKPNNPTEKWEHWYLDSGKLIFSLYINTQTHKHTHTHTHKTTTTTTTTTTDIITQSFSLFL